MKLAQLETFIAVAEELHFRRAAERLYTQPSAVSTTIQQLENEYGLPLFIRNSRNVQLTPAGQTLLTKARTILQGVNDLETTARQLAQPDHHTLNVGHMDESLAELTPIVAANVKARLPHLELNVQTIEYADFESALSDGDLDILITTDTPLAWEGGEALTSVPLFSETRSVVLPRDHHLADRASITSAEILDETFLHIDGLPPKLHRFFTLSDLRDLTRHPDASISVTHMQNVLSCVANSIGILTVTDGTPRFYPRPDIAYVPVTDIEPGTLYVTRRADDTRPHVLAYIDECINAVNTSLDLIPTATNATHGNTR